jgi:hypothetical protein
MYKSIALAAVKALHGDVGIMCEIDVIELLSDRSAVIRVDQRSLSHPLLKSCQLNLCDPDRAGKLSPTRRNRRAQNDLWSALTVLSSYEGEACRVHVENVSPFGLDLSKTPDTPDTWEQFVRS